VLCGVPCRARALRRFALGDSGRRRRAIFPLVHSGTAIGRQHLRAVNVPHTWMQQSLTSVARSPHDATPAMRRVAEGLRRYRARRPSDGW